jgi:hypothetical protein
MDNLISGTSERGTSVSRRFHDATNRLLSASSHAEDEDMLELVDSTDDWREESVYDLQQENRDDTNE